MQGYFKSNPYRQQKLKVFGKERPTVDSLILNHNSPFKPMMVKGTQQLIQSGVMNHLRDTYEGNFIPAISDAEAMVLKAGQLILIFALTAISMIISFAIFLVECCWDFRRRRMEVKNGCKSKPSKKGT